MAKFPLTFPVAGQTLATPPTVGSGGDFTDPWVYCLGGHGGFVFGAGPGSSGLAGTGPQGGTKQWAVVQSDGFGFPQMRHGDVSRPWDHGEFSGLDLMPGRDIQLTLWTQQRTSTDLQAALALLTRWFTPPSDGVVEQPFYFWRPTAPGASAPSVPGPSSPTYFHSCMVRARQFGLVTDYNYAYAHQAKPVAQLHATGALFYGPTQQYNFTGSATVPIVNGGHMQVHPLFQFFGPMPAGSTFSMGYTSPTTGASFILQFTLPAGPSPPAVSMASGDQLVVDTDLDVATALFYAGGTGLPTSWLTYLTGVSAPFMLWPGTTNLECVLPAGATAAVTWADGWAMAL
jgi:hypothetical protein